LYLPSIPDLRSQGDGEDIKKFQGATIVNIAKRVVGCIGSLLIVAVVGINSQAADATKIGVIDMKKVLSASTAGQKAQGVVEEKMKSLQGTLKKDETDLVALKTEIDKKGSAWTDAVKQEKAKAFQKKGQAFQEKQEKANLELKKVREENVNPILKKLEEIVEKVAKSEGYSLIVPRNVVLYASDATDVSDKVTAELNKVMK
jgi:outer membrane protein